MRQEEAAEDVVELRRARRRDWGIAESRGDVCEQGRESGQGVSARAIGATWFELGGSESNQGVLASLKMKRRSNDRICDRDVDYAQQEAERNQLS